MNLNVAGFKAMIAEVVSETTLSEKNWASPNWQKTWKLIDQDVLNDAYDQQGLICSLFSEIGEMVARKCKSLSRVEQKMTEQRSGRENYFKVVSDFAAVRVHCNVTEIQAKINEITHIVLTNGGHVYVRGTDAPYGFFMNADKTKYTDITQYVYIFIDKIGVPVEFQIGHEFASHTFTIDSAIRDNSTCGKVDLWTKDFYADVKTYILNQANGVEQQPETKEQLFVKAKEIHPNATIPEDLAKILKSL